MNIISGNENSDRLRGLQAHIPGYRDGNNIDRKGNVGEDENGANGMIVAIAFGVVMFFLPIIVVLVRRYICRLKSFETVDEERRQAQIAARRVAANRRAAEMTPEHELEAITEERIKYVSESLISKKFVMNKKNNGEGVKKNDSSLKTKNSINENDFKTLQDGCAICLEKLKNGDDVCCSQDPDCSHLFHQECCFEWLLRQEGCPCCRRPFLKSHNQFST